MSRHGSVALILLAISLPAFGQDPPLPRPLDPIDRMIAPEPSFSPPAPLRSSIPASGPSALESEIEGLQAELKSFHALSDEVARATRAAELDADRTLLRQRQEMLDILTRLATQGVNAKPVEKSRDRKPTLRTEAAPPVAEDAAEVPAVTDAAVDQFALGKVLFRAGEYAKAEQAFRKATQTDDNRLMLKYLIATCLRKRSKWQPAIEAYREVAASDKDPVLRDLAKFQLDGIRWNEDTEKQIEELRKQRGAGK